MSLMLEMKLNSSEKSLTKVIESKVPSGSKAEIPNHNPKIVDHDTNKSLRIQGIPENFDKPAKENILLTNEKLKDVFNTLGLTSPIVNVKRLGNFDNSRSKLRTIMIELSNEWEKRTIFAISIKKRTQPMNQNIYILPALTREEEFKEYACLKKRREVIETGVARSVLKLRNFEIFEDDVKIEITPIAK